MGLSSRVFCRGISVVLIATWVVAGMSACTKRSSSVANVINIGNGAEPKDLDPHIVTGVPEHNILFNIFEPLVGKDPKTLDPIPGVAGNWTISKDGKTYTFKLRPDAKWSNGDPVTAQDFVYSWTRLLTPQIASEYAQNGYYIVNGKEFNTGKLKDASQLGVKALDDHTLEVKLVNPTPFFLSLLYHHSLYPVHKATIEKYGARWTRPENFVGNGAFTLDKWEMNKVITLKQNPHYWDKAGISIIQANYYPVEKLDTEEKMFRSGELHVTNEIPLEKIPTWQKDKSGAYQQHPYLGSYFYWVNVTKPPLDNKLVRKALALGFSRKNIAEFVTRGGQLPGTMFTPPGTGGFQPKSQMPADEGRIAEARALLKQAGYPDGKGLPTIEILYNTSDAHKKIAEALQQMWKKNLGIDVKLFNQEWKVYLDALHSHNYQLARSGWIGDYNDPNTFLDMLVTGSQLNNAGYSNKKYDDLIAAAAKEQNKQRRLAIFQQAEDILLDDLPVIPIYIYTRVYLKSPTVQGWTPNIEDIHPLKYVSVTPKTS